jgi:catechol 2,3-dioxygenase-like lactoylglutathione lyase family enzyme
MLGQAALMAFVATTDADRAKAFYADVLGLKLQADEPFALVFDANGTMLRIARVQSFNPAPFTVLGWIVPEIARSIESLAAKGVPAERFSGFPQDDLGVCTFPDGTKVAWFKDPDGNLLSLTQFA